MSRSSWILCAGIAIATAESASVAFGEEPRPSTKRVRPSVTVEVLDDARHVDDIISKLRKQDRARSTAIEPSRLDRPDRIDHIDEARLRRDLKREEVKRDLSSTPPPETLRNEPRASASNAAENRSQGAAEKHALERPSLPAAEAIRNVERPRVDRRNETRELRTERRDAHRSHK